MKITLDTLSYGNALRLVSPMWKIWFAGLLFTITFLSHPIVQIIIFIWMILWTVWYARIPWKPYFILLGTSLLFYLASVPALILEVEHVLHVPKESLFSYSTAGWTFYVTKNGVNLAGSILIRSLASLTCLFFILFTIPLLEILQVMKKLKIPHIVIELTLVMYRFIFLLADTAYGMLLAQQARGGHATFRAKIRDMSLIIVRLFDKTMQRYKGLTHGLISRGFTEHILLAPLQIQPVSLRYKIESIAGCCILLILEGWLRWEGRG